MPRLAIVGDSNVEDSGIGVGVVQEDLDGDNHASIETGGDDCDDDNGDVYPGAPEVCDDLDNDCNELVDDIPEDSDDTPLWYPDADGDGHGVEGDTETGCDQPGGYAPTADDCDDADAANFPGNDEICDSQDNDCDGGIDDEDPEGPTHAPTWGKDVDGDGYGTEEETAEACLAPEGFGEGTDDCDDGNVLVSPGGDEGTACDNLDNDCSGTVDDLDGFECTVVPVEVSFSYGEIGDIEDGYFAGSSAVPSEVCTDLGYSEGADIVVGYFWPSCGGPGFCEDTLGEDLSCTSYVTDCEGLSYTLEPNYYEAPWNSAGWTVDPTTTVSAETDLEGGSWPLSEGWNGGHALSVLCRGAGE